MLKIEQIKIDKYADLKSQFQKLCKDPDVYIVYNVYKTALQFFERVNRETSFEDNWRVKPFREYYERNCHKEFFDMILADRLNGVNALVRIGWEKSEDANE